MTNKNNKEAKLKKELGFWDVTLATAGYIIGAGIFAILGITSKYGKEFSWLSVLVCGIFASFTGLSYSELSSMFNQNGGEYIIAKETFNHTVAKIIAIFTVFTMPIFIEVSMRSVKRPQTPTKPQGKKFKNTSMLPMPMKSF